VGKKGKLEGESRKQQKQTLGMWMDGCVCVCWGQWVL